MQRDLKSANIILTRAGAKLLDFGLARHVTPDARAGGAPMATSRSR